MTEARTFPDEIRKLFEPAGHWAVFSDQSKAMLQGLGVKLEPFCVPHTSNPAANDLRGFEMLAYGRGGTSYGVLADRFKAEFGDQARREALARGKSDKEADVAARAAAGKAIGYLGVALFRVAWLTARDLVKESEGQVPGAVLGSLRFSVNLDTAMLAEPLFAQLIDNATKPPFTLYVEASEDLQVGDVSKLQTLLAVNDWLKLALDDSDKMRAGTRKLLSERVDLVKADGAYVRRLFDDELVQPGTMLPALVRLRQPGKPFVAEGVETAAIKHILHNNWNVSAYGELLMQGWHMRVPAPWDTWLRPIGGESPERPVGYLLPAETVSDRLPAPSSRNKASKQKADPNTGSPTSKVHPQVTDNLHGPLAIKPSRERTAAISTIPPVTGQGSGRDDGGVNEKSQPTVASDSDSWQHDELVIRRALKDMGIKTPRSLPRPGHSATGVAGRSRVWFLSFPTSTNGELNLIAKLDEPARAGKEWDAIEQLRRLNTPLEAILPMPGNRREHGCVIYQNTAGLVSSGKVWTLKHLLLTQLASNQENCLWALDKMLDTLRLFYQSEPGAARLAGARGATRWQDAFPKLHEMLPELRGKYGASATGQVGSTLPDPFTEAGRYLAEQHGRVLCSRVHGDANLTNFLVGMNGRFRPERIFIIDLADSRDGVPTALDLARLEADFWHEVFGEWNAGEAGEPGLSERLQTFTTLRSLLDGRPGAADQPAHAAATWVNRIRTEAHRLLAAGQPDYAMHDYMVALYLTHLASLRFPSIQHSPVKIQIALAGAASALDYLLKLEHGKQPAMPLLPEKGLPPAVSSVAASADTTAASETSRASGPSIGIIPGKANQSQDAPGASDPALDAFLLQQIMAILEASPTLRAGLTAELGVDVVASAGSVAKALFGQPVQDVIEKVLVPVTKEVLRQEGGKRSVNGQAVWANANSLFGWLCLRIASGEASKDAADAATPPAWTLINRKLVSVEAFMARAVPRPVDLEWTPGTPEVRGRGAVLGESESGWGHDKFYQQLLVRLWNLVFKGRLRSAPEKKETGMEPLNTDELGDLKAELASLRDAEPTRFMAYYLVFQESSRGPLLEDALNRLKQDFPGLGIVIYRAASGVSALLVPESRFQAAVRRFLEIETMA